MQTRSIAAYKDRCISNGVNCRDFLENKDLWFYFDGDH